MKSLKRLTNWQKIRRHFKPFRKKHLFAIIAGGLFLLVWAVEKFTIEYYRDKISEFNRYDNTAQHMLFGNRVLELQIEQTIQDNNHGFYPDERSYYKAFYTNSNNLITQENECWLTLQVQADIVEEDMVKEVAAEKYRKDTSWQNTMARDTVYTGNKIVDSVHFQNIYNYRNWHTQDFSAEKAEVQIRINSILPKLNRSLNWWIFLYAILYLISAGLLTCDKILNFRSDES